MASNLHVQFGNQRTMDVRHLRQRVLPASERDENFRRYVRRVSCAGLETLAIVEIVAPALLEVGRLALDRTEALLAPVMWRVAGVLAVGVGTLAASHLRWSARHPRLLAALSAWLVAAVLMWFGFAGPQELMGEDDYILAGITLVMIMAVSTVPLLPWHALAMGLAVEAVYVLSSVLHGSAGSVWGAHAAAQNVFFLVLTLLATGISVINYGNRRREFESSREAVRAAEALTGAQLRAQLAENAISIGKMAAALSHEINSPLGALRSSVETLLALTDRQIEGTGARPELLAQARSELCRSIHESAARIEEVTLRLRRFVMLEEEELKEADLNDLVWDVTLLHQDAIAHRGIKLDFELEKTIPSLSCRPQLLTAVFSSLLANAIDAVNGQGHIQIATHRTEEHVEVTIRDNGRGMPPEQAATIFEPSFKVEGGRVSSANWSLFNTRQIVYEHGGEIRLETTQGKGTAVSVTLPLK